MSLLARKARPIPNRDKDPSSLRDDRLFFVACDDTYAPKQYFGFLRITRVKIIVIPTEDGTSVAEFVLERLLTAFEHDEDDELWMLLDTDHLIQGTHVPGFVQALKEAEQKGVRVALSRPCFELWLLLHHVDELSVKTLANADEVESALRQTLGEYRKSNLKQEHYALDRIADAVKRAHRLDSTVDGGLIPTANTTRVYKLLQAITSKALSSQLPAELR